MEYQGGVMTSNEADNFGNDALFETSIRMWRWDELAKETEVALIDLQALNERARSVLARSWNKLRD